jgi:hypothetical protein
VLKGFCVNIIVMSVSVAFDYESLSAAKATYIPWVVRISMITIEAVSKLEQI